MKRAQFYPLTSAEIALGRLRWVLHADRIATGRGLVVEEHGYRMEMTMTPVRKIGPREVWVK